MDGCYNCHWQGKRNVKGTVRHYCGQISARDSSKGKVALELYEGRDFCDWAGELLPGVHWVEFMRRVGELSWSGNIEPCPMFVPKTHKFACASCLYRRCKGKKPHCSEVDKKKSLDEIKRDYELFWEALNRICAGKKDRTEELGKAKERIGNLIWHADAPCPYHETRSDRSHFSATKKKGKDGMLELKIKPIRKDNYAWYPPIYATDGAAGIDLCAQGGGVIDCGRWRLIDTGISVEIPPGFEGQVRPRSGLAKEHGVTVLNAPGTIDSDYRGEIKVILINHGTMPFKILGGDRIAQLVIAPVQKCAIVLADELSQTARRDGGFGSTGR